jgi:LPXTG-motif cell wall-anchored protein
VHRDGEQAFRTRPSYSTPVIARLALTAAVAVLALATTGIPPALAQTTTQPGGPSLSPAPPVSLGGNSKTKTKSSSSQPTSSSSSTQRSSSSSRPSRGRLPNTGYDAGGVALLGAGLLLAGVGLRLRTRDVRWP